MVVAAYVENHGCILAASREAKQFGIKTGMRVWEGKQIFPKLIVLPPDPEKYRFVNHQLERLLSEYSSELSVESIDEMVLQLKNSSIVSIAKEIKQRIKNEIGEWLTVSIGIAPNRYLAKVASSLHKPDGLDVIDKSNIEEVFSNLALEDLCGIKEGYGGRLRATGIATPLNFYHTSPIALKRAFRSVVGYGWWLRLHGWEGGTHNEQFKATEQPQKSFGQSYAFGKPYLPAEPALHQILSQLVVKMGRRLRADGFIAGGIGTSCLFVDHTYWQHHVKQSVSLFADIDLYTAALKILQQGPDKPVRILTVHCFDLTKTLYQQESLLSDEDRKVRLTQALDAIHDRWGDFMVTSGRMLGMEPASTRREPGRVQRGEHKVLDRIAFGGVK